MNHPNLAQLWEYLEEPETASQGKTLDHITGCAACRTRVARLAALQTRLQRTLPRFSAIASTGAEADALDISHWIDSTAANGHDLAQEARLKHPAQLKAALHYAVHRSALQRDLPETHTLPPRARHAARDISFLQRIARLFMLRLPVWIPAATAAALVWATLGLSRLDSGDAARTPPLVSYQDAPVMHFQPADGAPPGIGFFSAASSSERPFTGVRLTRPQPGVLELNWPAVDNAAGYRVALYRIANFEREAIAEQTATVPQVSFNNFDFTPNRRYEWEISGSTHDGNKFSARGGFVVPESQNPWRNHE